MFIPDPDLDFYRIQGSKRHWITDSGSGSGSATLNVPDLPVRLLDLLYDFRL
jgi:hypothetical protein